MWARDYRDIIGGGLLILLGIATLIYCLAGLRLGTFARMGPGFFPAALGVILLGLGLAILVPALFRGGEPVRPDFRTLFFLTAGVLAFAALIRPFGLIPATAVLTVIVCQASAMSIKAVVITAAALSLTATLLFPVALGLQVSPVNWPW